MIARKAMKDEGLTLLTRVTLLYRLFVRFDPGQVPRSDASLDGKSSKMMDVSLSVLPFRELPLPPPILASLCS